MLEVDVTANLTAFAGFSLPTINLFAEYIQTPFLYARFSNSRASNFSGKINHLNMQF